MGKKFFERINKKVLYAASIAVCIIVILAVILIIHAVKNQKANRTVNVAFYGLSEEFSGLIQEYIPQDEKDYFKIDVISDGDFDAEKIKSKYDVLFCWNGEITDLLAAGAEDIPQNVLEVMPGSVRQNSKKCAPILLDHCELAFRTEVVNKNGGDLPYSYTNFKKYLYKAKSQVFSPFYCNGAEDRILIDLIGELVLAYGGLSAYKNIIEELRQAEKLEQIIDKELVRNVTLRKVLDELKAMPEEGLTHPSWYQGRGNDLLYFAEDGQVGVFFTLLSEHRKIPYNVVKNYESSLFPPEVTASYYGLVAPAVSVMLFSDNSRAIKYIESLFAQEAQEDLSNKSKLAPVHARAQAYDRQADDVRYWAAACAGGALPDLYNAAFQLDSRKLEKLSSEIRNYVR